MTRHISRDQMIAGVSVLEVRRAFRSVGFRSITKRVLSGRLPNLSRVAVNRLWKALLGEGYISFGCHDDEPEEFASWLLTEKGFDLIRATAAAPITRRTADRLLSTSMDRADLMRAERTRFAYTPARIYVYGSYLTDKERLGDLDVAVEWEPRHADPDAQFKYNLQLAREASEAGRQFPNYTQYLFWGMKHAELFLRNRARGLSLNTIEFPERGEHIIFEVPHRMVYHHGERIVAPVLVPHVAREQYR